MKPLILQTDEVKNDFDKVKNYIERSPGDIRYASEELRNNQELCDLAFRLDPFVYEFLGDSIKENKDIAFDAFKANTATYRHFPLSLKNDESFNLMIVEYNFGAIETVMDHKWRSNPKIMKAVVLQEPEYLRKVECDIFSDKVFLEDLIRKNQLSYFFLPREVKKDVDFKLKVLDAFDDSNRFLLLDGLVNKEDISNFVEKFPYLYKDINVNFREKGLSLFYVRETKSVDSVPSEHFRDKDFWMDVRKSLAFKDASEDAVFQSSPNVKLLLKDKEIKKAFNDALKEEKLFSKVKPSTLKP